jgi:hypothetical protein
MKQLQLPIADDDHEAMRTLPPWEWPTSMLIECRARRLGCSESELRSMRSYDLNRELAEEVALQSLGPGNERIRSYRPNWDQIDAQVRREAAERIEDFEEWRRLKK